MNDANIAMFEFIVSAGLAFLALLIVWAVDSRSRRCSKAKFGKHITLARRG